MAGRLACERPELLAGLAQVAGTAAATVAAGLRPRLAMPVIQIHGTADRYAPYAGGVRRGARARLVLRHSFGPSVGVEEWARFWITANRAGDIPEVFELPPDTTVRRWRAAAAAADVVFYRVGGGGHTWPGSLVELPRLFFGRTSRTFEARRVIWDFFARQKR